MKSSCSRGTSLNNAGAAGAAEAAGLPFTVPLKTGVDLAVDGLLAARETRGALLDDGTAALEPTAVSFVVGLTVAVALGTALPLATRDFMGAAVDVPGLLAKERAVDAARTRPAFGGRLDAAVAGRARTG
jgi:hypothetical protein